MYAFIAVVLVAAFALVTVALPLRWQALYTHLRNGLRRTVLCTANQAVFQADDVTARQTLRCVQMWFFVSAGVFAVLGIYDGTVIRNDPDAIGKVAAYCVLACVVSSFIVLSVIAYAWLIPGVRGYATLSRCGFRGFWILNRPQLPANLQAHLEKQVSDSARVRVLNVSGYELFVKGQGNRDGILKEVLLRTPNVPVSLLLLNPLTHEVDPDRKQVTVYQSVLSEMGMQASTYMKRIQSTLESVQFMNETRPPEAQIEVRFYNEKPTMRSVISDDSMVVFPWKPLVQTVDMPCMEVARQSAVPSFYETFRRDFARLWKSGVVQIFTSSAVHEEVQ